MTKEKRRVAVLQNMGIITLVLVSLFYLNKLFESQIQLLFTAVNAILLPFGIALFISYILAPLVKLLETKFKLSKRWMTVSLVLVILLLAIGLFMYIVGITIYEQAEQFILSDWDNMVASIEKIVQDNEFLLDVYNQISEYLTFEDASPILFNVINIFKGLVGIMVSVVLVPVFLVFLLHDKQRIFKGIIGVVPRKYRFHIEELGKRANDVIEKYFNGRFLSMLIVSIMFTIVLLIFGFTLDKAIFFGFTLGFLDIIPYIGGFIGIMLPVLFSFTILDTVLFGQWAFIGLIACNLVIQFLQGNVIQPYIMGKEVNLHPLLVLSSFIFFGSLFGITGIILAIPITGTIKTSLEYYANDYKPEKKKT